MEAIVAVYEDWGIGCDGTQPVALSADRKFFRSATLGATVIVGRKTLAAFPGGKPLPRRKNIVLSRSSAPIPGVTVCRSVQQAAQAASGDARVMVIGGGSIYRQMLPLCSAAYVTKLRICPKSDTFFPDLDRDPDWYLEKILQSGEENGIFYQMCLYKRRSAPV